MHMQYAEMFTPRKIGLIAASRRQRSAICRARDSYELSPVFRRARDSCERYCGEWYVVSVRHGRLLPQQVIGPDETALLALTASERAAWGRRLADALQARAGRSAEPITFALYASQRMAEVLMRAVPALTFELPLSGLSLADRLRWYDDRLRIAPHVLGRVALVR